PDITLSWAAMNVKVQQAGVGTGNDTMVIEGLGGNDTTNVQKIKAGTSAIINPGLGTNTINVGTTAPAVGGRVNEIKGTLSIKSTGRDTINIDDTASTGATGVMDASTLTGLGMGSGKINFSGQDTLNLRLGAGPDTL